MPRTVLIVDHLGFRASAWAPLESEDFELFGEDDTGAAALRRARRARSGGSLLRRSE